MPQPGMAIKDAWRGLLEAKVERMSDRISLAFINLVTCEQGGGLPDAMKEKLSTSFEWQVLSSRLDAGYVVVSDPMKAWICCISDRVGLVVMWAYTLAYMFAETRETVTMETFSNYFPLGIPTADECGRLWEEQKYWEHPEHGSVDNGVDHYAFWPKPEISNEPSV